MHPLAHHPIQRKALVGPVLLNATTQELLCLSWASAQPCMQCQRVLPGAQLTFSECWWRQILCVPYLCRAVLQAAFLPYLPSTSAHFTTTPKAKPWCSYCYWVGSLLLGRFSLSEGLLFILGGGVWLQSHLSVCVHISRISMVLTFPLQEFEECSIIYRPWNIFTFFFLIFFFSNVCQLFSAKL